MNGREKSTHSFSSCRNSPDLSLSVEQEESHTRIHGDSSKILINGPSLNTLINIHYHGRDQDYSTLPLLASDQENGHIQPQSALVAATSAGTVMQDSVQDAELCCSTRHGDIKLTGGSPSLAEIYKKHEIRWRVCKRCGGQDEAQECFRSELVLGMEHCLCSTIERERRRLDHWYSSSLETGGISSSNTAARDCSISPPIEESNTHSSAKLIMNGEEYFTS